MEPKIRLTKSDLVCFEQCHRSLAGNMELMSMASQLKMKFVLVTLLIISDKVHADDCDKLTGSGDGVPTKYYQHKCMAEHHLKNKEYTKAAMHYEKASAVRIFEAPNYNLRLEWGYSLCLAGNKEQGAAKIDSFTLMAKADLGEFKCPDTTDEHKAITKVEHMGLACIGYGSTLSKQGRHKLKKRLQLAKKYMQACSNL